MSSDVQLKGNVRVTGRREWQQVRADLETKILVFLLASPAAVEFTSFDGLAANVHARRNIIVDGRKTGVGSDAERAERPADSRC